MLFQAAKEQQLKVRHYIDCKVLGYTSGSGDRSNTFGALEVAEVSDGELTYRGKVGTGFSEKDMQEIYALLSELPETEKPGFAPSSPDTTWIKPLITAEVSYSEINPNGTFRAPVFERFKR